MFYDARKNEHGLKHDPFKAIVAPRPIGWITSMSAAGEINLAPYSFFNGVCSRPNLVMFSSEGRKDSLAFIEETKEFVCNLATFDLRDAMNKTSAPFERGVNEMERAGLAPAPSRLVKPPRVAASPCALECVLLQIVPMDDIERTRARYPCGVRPGDRRPYRRPIHQGRPARYRRHEADRALRLSQLRRGREPVQNDAADHGLIRAFSPSREI